SELEALKTITLNGAKQLGLDKRIGTIEIGKDADLVIFNGHPLNSYSRVDMTLVEGEIYFERPDRLKPVVAAAPGPNVPRNGFNPPPRNAEGNYLLENVTAHTVTGATILRANVLVSKGRIAGVTSQAEPRSLSLPAGTTSINAEGLHLYP